MRLSEWLFISTEPGRIGTHRMSSPSTESAEATSGFRVPIWLLLLLMIVGMAVINAVPWERLTPGKPPKSAPGVVRGDLVLKESDLPKVINDWTRTGFQPAASNDELAPGQYWWTHIWQYGLQGHTAIVAFDQADWKSWHELTICYQANDWILQRRVVIEQTDGWDVVVAQFQRQNGERSALMFSLFADDGEPVAPPGITASGLPGLQNGLLQLPESDWGQIFRDRLNMKHYAAGRLHQCQVFCPLARECDRATLQHLLELHLQSRQIFRDRWLNQ